MSEGEMIIRKETVQVEVRDFRGETRRGALFARPADGVDRGERLIDILATREFVPLKGDDKVIFVSTRQLVWLRLDLLAGIDELDPEIENAPDSNTAHVILDLSDGSRLEGFLRYALPPSQRRLGDYLERLRAFFPVRTDDWLYLVRAESVVAVEPLAEERGTPPLPPPLPSEPVTAPMTPAAKGKPVALKKKGKR
jgi:hypothetical protein